MRNPIREYIANTARTELSPDIYAVAMSNIENTKSISAAMITGVAAATLFIAASMIDHHSLSKRITELELK